LSVPEELPRILCQPQQLRQAILHCLQFAMDAVELAERDGERVVRLEANAEEGQVRIVIAHSGPGFESPNRAFDPFVPARYAGAETAGIGLSLCATILRENNGQASAKNLDPTGAAIILDLQAA
jgi:C4-dicarboxylate-specific signal transduction histidine kinase